MSRWFAAALLLVACDETAETPEEACRICDAATEYCVRNASDIADEPDSYTCRALPAACANEISCECVGDELDTGSGDGWCFANGGCEALVTGPLMITCPGG